MPRSLRWPDLRVKPPYGAAEINWGHALAGKLVFLSILNDGGGGGTDLVRGGLGTRSGNIQWAGDTHGVMLSGAGGTDQLQFAAADYTASPFSAFTICRQTSSFDYQYPGGNGVSGSNTGWVMHTRYGGVSHLGVAYAGVDEKDSGLTITDGVLNYAGFAQSAFGNIGTEMQYFLNGTTAQSGAAAPNAGPTHITIAGELRDAGAGQGFVGTMSFWAVWSGRALSVSDFFWLAAEPYAMLQPIVRRRYFVPAAVVTTRPRRALMGVGF